MTQAKGKIDVDVLRHLLAKRLIPAVPVPLDAQGRVHHQAQASYQRYLSTQDIAGVAVWAHTGRGLYLDNQISIEVLQSWRSALADKVIITGVGAKHCDVADRRLSTLKMAELAALHGADAFLVYPPTWLRGATDVDKAIIDHHAELATLGVPLILFYLYEAAGGITYSSAVLDKLLEMPEVVGIKMATLDSVMTYQDVSKRLLERHPDKLLITGEDRFLGYSLRRGAHAALIGMGAICCELQMDLMRANFENDSATFLSLSDTVDQLAEAIFIEPMEGYIKRLLWLLVHLGVIPIDAANDPWGPNLSTDEFDALGKTLEMLFAVDQKRRR